MQPPSADPQLRRSSPSAALALITALLVATPPGCYLRPKVAEREVTLSSSRHAGATWLRVQSPRFEGETGVFEVLYRVDEAVNSTYEVERKLKGFELAGDSAAESWSKELFIVGGIVGSIVDAVATIVSAPFAVLGAPFSAIDQGPSEKSVDIEGSFQPLTLQPVTVDIPGLQQETESVETDQFGLARVPLGPSAEQALAAGRTQLTVGFRYRGRGSSRILDEDDLIQIVDARFRSRGGSQRIAGWRRLLDAMDPAAQARLHWELPSDVQRAIPARRQ